MSVRPRPEVETLEPSPHGGLDYAELRAIGLSPDDVLDFSVSSNPRPAPAGVRKTLSSVAIERHPDSEAIEFRRALSVKLGVPPDNIIAGNGSVELIRLIALAYFRAGDSVLILEPTFGEYRVAAQIAGARIVSQRGQEKESFAPKVDEALRLIRQHNPRGVFICNPNNPTGHYLGRAEIETILGVCRDGLLILDEAYVGFVDKAWSSLDLMSRGNIVILRSMTKDYALPGLRLGYAIAAQEIIGALRRVRPPWNVNSVALTAGVAALEEGDYLGRCRQEVRSAKKFLTGELRRLGFTVMPSAVNFFLVKVREARSFRAALLQHGILVRDGTSFGLPEYVRIGVRTMPECQRLVAVVEAMKAQDELATTLP